MTDCGGSPCFQLLKPSENRLSPTWGLQLFQCHFNSFLHRWPPHKCFALLLFFEQERGLCYPCYEKNMIASLEMYDLYVLTGITLLALQDLSVFTVSLVLSDDWHLNVFSVFIIIFFFLAPWVWWVPPGHKCQRQRVVPKSTGPRAQTPVDRLHRAAQGQSSHAHSTQ